MASTESFDYVVIGGGTAGCVLTARLSQDLTTRVALLEAGAAEGPEAMSSADRSVGAGLRGSAVDWAYSTIPQDGTDGRVHAWASGKVLGGSSSINGMVHLRGHRSSYNAWEQKGAAGWSYDSLLPYLKRSERADGRNPEFRGTEGPMFIELPPTATALAQAMYQAALDVGHPECEDGNGYGAEGVSWMETNTVANRRQSAADAYLRPVLSGPNLTVITGADVRRLLFDRQRCYGIEYNVAGEERTIRAERGVVLSAGTVGSPRILLQSGIGPADHLRSVGIPVRVDLPGVGSNLHDHLLGWVSFKGHRPLVDTVSRQGYLLTRSATGADPDILMSFVPYVMGSVRLPGYSIIFSVVTPTSRGSLCLRGADPAIHPVIDPGYLSHVRDLDRMVIALRMALDIGRADALAPWRDVELLPSLDSRDDKSCRNYIRRQSTTYYHPVGTCRIGTDELSVVDPMLRVRGVDCVWISDASVMPSIVSANTNATVLGIAERAVDLITESTTVAAPAH